MKEWLSKKRGKWKKRRTLGPCDELRGGLVMMVTRLTPSVLLPGTGSEMSLLNPRAGKCPLPRGDHAVLRALSGVQVEGDFSMGHWNVAGADAYRFRRIFCFWSILEFVGRLLSSFRSRISKISKNKI